MPCSEFLKLLLGFSPRLDYLMIRVLACDVLCRQIGSPIEPEHFKPRLAGGLDKLAETFARLFHLYPPRYGAPSSGLYTILSGRKTWKLGVSPGVVKQGGNGNDDSRRPDEDSPALANSAEAAGRHIARFLQGRDASGHFRYCG